MRRDDNNTARQASVDEAIARTIMGMENENTQAVLVEEALRWFLAGGNNRRAEDVDQVSVVRLAGLFGFPIRAQQIPNTIPAISSGQNLTLIGGWNTEMQQEPSSNSLVGEMGRLWNNHVSATARVAGNLMIFGSRVADPNRVQSIRISRSEGYNPLTGELELAPPQANPGENNEQSSRIINAYFRRAEQAGLDASGALNAASAAEFLSRAPARSNQASNLAPAFQFFPINAGPNTAQNNTSSSPVVAGDISAPEYQEPPAGLDNTDAPTFYEYTPINYDNPKK